MSNYSVKPVRLNLSPHFCTFFLTLYTRSKKTMQDQQRFGPMFIQQSGNDKNKKSFPNICQNLNMDVKNCTNDRE